ncbi:hypothetical protein, partial [Neisseria meningitidis serogroup B]
VGSLPGSLLYCSDNRGNIPITLTTSFFDIFLAFQFKIQNHTAII